MTHGGEVSPAAARQLRKLDGDAQRRVQAVVELLAKEPRPAGARKLVGGRGLGLVGTTSKVTTECDSVNVTRCSVETGIAACCGCTFTYQL